MVLMAESGEGGDQKKGRLIPMENIKRIMRKTMPAHGKISRGAIEFVQECISEFISFITTEASDKSEREKRTTINADDLLWAMEKLELHDYIPPLRLYLKKVRESSEFVPLQGSSSQAMGLGSNFPGFLNPQIGQGPSSSSQVTGFGSNFPGYNVPNAQLDQVGQPSSSQAFYYGSNLPGFNVPNPQIGQGHYSQAMGFGSNFPGYAPYAQVGQGPSSSSQAMGLGPILPGFSVPNAAQIGQVPSTPQDSLQVFLEGVFVDEEPEIEQQGSPKCQKRHE